jgi:hypothetical protein
VYTSNDPKVIARAYVNQAIGSYNSGNNYDAQVNLARALVTDPDLKTDPEIRELASKYTGLDAGAAIKRLTTPAKNSPSNERGESVRDNSGGGDQWYVVLLELVVLFVAAMFLFVFILSLARQFPNEIIGQMGGRSSASVRAEMSRILTMTEPVRLIQTGFYGALIVVGGVIVWNIIMYAFCVTALGGMGGIGSHMSAAFRVQIVSLLLQCGTILLSVWALRLPPGSQTTVSGIASALGGLTSLGTTIALIYFISKAHQFDWVKGFVAVVLSPIIIACGFCGLVSLAGFFR